jgi:hypothetical protein
MVQNLYPNPCRCYLLFTLSVFFSFLFLAQVVYVFHLHNNMLFCVSELMDSLLTSEDQSQADQLNSLAEGLPSHSPQPCKSKSYTGVIGRA